MAAHTPVKGGGDSGIAQIKLGQLHLGLGGKEPSLARVPFIVPFVDVSLRRGLLLNQPGVPDIFGLGMFQLGLFGQNLGLGLLQVGLILLLLDKEQQFAFLHGIAILE